VDAPPAAPRKYRSVRIAHFLSHPIQYQSPLLRRIAQEPDIDMTTFFSTDVSVRGYLDSAFGVELKWDVPLLEGYQYEFLPRLRDLRDGDRLGFVRPLNWGILERLQRGRFDAVWVQGYHRLVSLNAILAAKMLRIPVMLRTDSNLFSPVRAGRTLILKTIFTKLLRPLISAVLSIGEANTAYWRHYFGNDFPVFTLPFAVDNDFFQRRAAQAAPRREQLRRELGLEPARPIILCASKLTPRKRCIDLVEAFIRLSPAPGVDPSAYLVIVGDGEERANLEARVRASGLSAIRFLGFRNQTELPSLYNLCDVFVMPSHSEPWGLIVNEVMNAGRAVIVTDQAGCHFDLVRHGFNGFVYPAFDVEALASYMQRLIDNPGLRASMGENSLRLIQQFTFEQDIAGLRQALAHTIPGFAAN
jgi:glycosyltransferase involved in cell wall biosynthesis